MDQQPYTQPETCHTGQVYYLKIERNGSWAIYRPVQFLAYRPCAAELLVRDGGKTRVIDRVDLYQKGIGQSGDQ